jgi:hypothetical protein
VPPPTVKSPGGWTVLGARSLQVLISFVIVTYSQVRKGYALCRTRDLPGALESHLETIFGSPCHYAHLTYCILGGLLYGIHSDMPIRTLSGSAGGQVDLSGQTVPSRPNTPLGGHLFDREPYGGERERARAPDPDKFRPRGGLGRSRGTCLPPATMSSLACQNPIKRRCTVNRDTLTKPGAMMFFSYLSSVTLADSEKNHRVSHFTTNPFTDRPLTPPPANARS